MFWRRRKPAGQWVVVVSRIRPLDPNGGGRDELRWPEQQDAVHNLDSRKAADDVAGQLRGDASVQNGRKRVKVLFTGH